MTLTKDNVRAFFPGPYQVVLEDLEKPDRVPPERLLIRTLYTLISPGTELALYTHTHIGFNDPNHTFARYPFYPGYAAVGQVEAVGSGITAFQPGDTVFYFGHHQRFEVVAPSEMPVLHVPAGIPPQLVPFARLAQIAYTALYVVEERPSDTPHTVLVIGLGLVGNLAAQLFRISGASIYGSDLSELRRDTALQCGITPIDGLGADATVSVLPERAGHPTIVVEATGNPALVHSALKLVRPRGQVVLLGSPRGSMELDAYTLIHRPGVALIGAHEAVLPALSDSGLNRQAVASQMLNHLQRGQLIVEPLISRVLAPHQMREAYQALLEEKDSVIGILIDWSC